jgi:SpoVK/Ycf46/Vps4 family AAA+-type ATPase
MSNAALDGLIAALGASGDARLLVPALDLAASDADRARVLDGAEPLDAGSLDAAQRVRVAAAAADAERWQLALRFAAGVDAALRSEALALLRLGRRAEAEARYWAVVRDNPTLEEPALLAELTAGEADTAQSNIVPLRPIRAGQSDALPESEEATSARLRFVEAGRISFKDVGGHTEVKKQIARRIIAPFEKPSMFARFRRSAGGGVLLYGPPGCGKTMIARATAGECNARFVNVPATDVLDKYYGEPERKLAAIFAEARRETPTVLFFDEIEALAGKRNHQSSQHEVALVSTFLAELDGFEKANAGVLILAATNMPWAIDAAFRRSGRFDRQLFVPPPDKEARAEILRLQLEGRPVEPGLDLVVMAGRASGFSGADIENLVDTAADLAIEESLDRGSEQPIGKRHLEAALEEVRPTTAEWLTTARNFAKYGNSGGQYDEITEFLKKHGR